MNQVVVILLSLLLASGGLFGQTVESDILQVRLDRIYLAAGAESGLFQGANFYIKCGEDSILAGQIDYCGPGISYSQAIPGLDSLTVDSACRAIIATAEINERAEIVIGTDLPLVLFDNERECLFHRDGDSISPVLVDSFYLGKNSLELHLSPGIFFSDGSRLDAGVIIRWLSYLKKYATSHVARYFCSRIKDIDENGLEIIDGYNLRINFVGPFPRALYYLAHPELVVFNANRSGTGPLMEVPGGSPDKKVFVTNPYYRGEAAKFERLTIQQYGQAYRMRFAYDAGQIDGYIGFGFDQILAGTYMTRAEYPFTAVILPGIGASQNEGALFPTSLYYRFDPDRAHLYFPPGDVKPINRWLIEDSSNQRYFKFDFIMGKDLHHNIRFTSNQLTAAYGDPLLDETARYLADIAAREGMTSQIVRKDMRGNFDFCVTFLPSSDSILPLSLIGCVLEINDQNAYLPGDQKLEKPGWVDLATGSTLFDTRYRNNYFRKAARYMVEEIGCFPLFRPEIYAVGNWSLNGLTFDSYGYPRVERAVKFTTPPATKTEEKQP